MTSRLAGKHAKNDRGQKAHLKRTPHAGTATKWDNRCQ